MKQIKFFCCLIFIFFSVLNNLSAQEKKNQLESLTREEIMQMTTDQLLALPLEDLVFLSNKLGVSIDDLLKMQTSVASKTELAPRETPGIVSVVTAEEIRHSGARDLIDVLKLVPGFDFEYDVDGVVGLGFRGSWVHEGKALIMLDGQMMNDLAYYNTPFGNHIDVTQIKKIEIVRGPGSAIYGGNAELCVINIITNSGKDINGVSAGVTYGQLPENYGRINGSLQVGTKVDKWDLALKTFVGQANRSNGNYIDNYDTTTKKSFIQDFSKNGSQIETQNINLSAKRENLSFQFLYDNYNSQCVTDSELTYNKFRNISSSVKYDFHLSNKLIVSPVFTYQYSRPFYDTLLSSRSYTVQRYKIGAGLNYEASKNITVIGGAELYRDQGRITDNTYGSHNLNLDNMALYAQILWKVAGFNLVVGGRGEKNTEYGSAFAPRVGITRVMNNFHFKILASQSFRSPAIGNIDVSENLKIEKTFVLETEIGYKINDNMFITGNIYDISIKNPIIYYDNNEDAPRTGWGYKNASSQGSDGVELEYKYKYFWGYSSVSYSFYTDRWKSIPANYQALGHEGSVLGLPQQKFTYLAAFRLNDRFNITPSFIYSGVRYGYIQDLPESGVLKKYQPSYLLNLNLSVSNVLTQGLDLDFGVFNILNEKSAYIQPYYGGYGCYPPYPGREREFTARLVYNFKFNK
jgi:outer membrane cobalamin receptor